MGSNNNDTLKAIGILALLWWWSQRKVKEVITTDWKWTPINNNGNDGNDHGVYENGDSGLLDTGSDSTVHQDDDQWYDEWNRWT